MISAGDFRKGLTVEINGEVHSILDFQHVKPGKGAAFVRTKIKNEITGAIMERTFNPSEKFPPARVERKQMQYLYDDGNLCFFMDLETYEQMPLNREQVEDALKYIKEDMTVNIKFYQGQAFSVEPPNFVELEVTQTDPGYKGDTASAGSKPAVVETGAVVQVPIFINVGDIIRIDTRIEEYMERV